MLDPSIRLRNAIIEANLPITKRLLHRYPDLWLNIDPFNNGWSNLHYAAYHGNYLICFHLVTLHKNKRQYTEGKLRSSVFFDEEDTYNGDDLDPMANEHEHINDMLTFDGLSVLHLPSINHKSQTLHYLLKEYPGQLWLNQKGGPELQTPIHYSCKYGFKEGLNLLLEFGADYTMRDIEGSNCLHIAMQYGHFNCIEALFQFIASKKESKQELEDSLQEFESTKNEKGWLPVEVASSFQISKQYKVFRKEIVDSFENQLLQRQQLHREQSQFIDGHDIIPPFHRPSSSSMLSNLSPLINPSSIGVFDSPSSNDNSPVTSGMSAFSDMSNSPQENRVLASPIVSLSSAKKIESNGKSDVRTRAYSLSLPNEPPEGISSPSFRPGVVRQRSSTTVTPSTIRGSATGNSGATVRIPHTPVISANMTKTPSLKSISISPSIRNNYDANYNSASSNSSKTSPNYTTKHQYPQLQHSKTPSLNQQWPTLANSGSPTNIIAQSATISSPTPSSASRVNHRASLYYGSPHAIQPVHSPSSSGQIPQSLDYSKANNHQQNPHRQTLSRRSSSSSSTSSIAAKIAYCGQNSSKSSLGTYTDSDSPRKTSLRNSPIKEGPPKIRKAKSSTAIEPATGIDSNLPLSSAKWASTSSFATLSGSSSDDLKPAKQPINSISFSRVGR